MKICILGRYGMVGSAIERVLRKHGCTNIVGDSHAQLDLTEQLDTEMYIDREHPDVVILAAAVVGGIYANKTYPGRFIYSNLRIQSNVINACYQYHVGKVVFLGSSCIYPKFCKQPMTEDCLLTGMMEPTNKPYAVAKISGVLMCQSYNMEYGTNFTSIMPTNLYGPNDNYHPMDSHVLPGMIQKLHTAKEEGLDEVVLWGTGLPLREFLYSDDLAEAVWTILGKKSKIPDIINIGSGAEISIKDLAQIIKTVVGYTGKIKWDTDMPDGTPRKLLDSSIIRKMGWEPKIELQQGVRLAYEDFVSHNRRS